MLKIKQGAASFYIVAISTLILVILVTSFATAILAAITRSANDDLAQSAYDSAMAGIEEAKLAYANYRNCINLYPDLAGKITSLSEGDEVTCQDIIYWVEHPDGDDSNPSYNPCDMVALILGRTGKTNNNSKKDKRGEIGEVSLDQTITGGDTDVSSLDQAYTCVKIYTNPQDLFDNLSSANPYKVVKLTTENAAAVESIVLSWHMNKGDTDFSYSNIVKDSKDSSKGRVVFPPFSSIDSSTGTIEENYSTPATIAFTIVQTPNTGFTFNELNGTSTSSSTDRATMIFVPTGDESIADSANPVTSSSTYIGIYDKSGNVSSDNINYLSANQIASTNNHKENLPYVAYCNKDKQNDFACSVVMDLPKPVSGDNRSDYTFSFIVSLPYSKPSTVFSVEFTCNNGKPCTFTNEYNDSGTGAIIDNDQVIIDSTGRAGDMYKRVEVRLESEVSAMINGYPFYAIQADTITKNNKASTEWGVEVPEPEPEPENSNCPADTPYMQDWNDADALAIEQTITLRDKRDNQCYTVAKLKGGKVWMTENLNIAGGTTLTSELSDVSSSYALPESSSAAHNGAFIYNSGNKNCDGASPCYSYYSSHIAFAGSPLSTNKNDANAADSICPKHWKLPTATDVRDMISAYSGSGSVTYYYDDSATLYEQLKPGTVPNFVLSGEFYKSGDENKRFFESYGYFRGMTSTRCSGGYICAIVIGANTVLAATNGQLGSAQGVAVRCVYND